MLLKTNAKLTLKPAMPKILWASMAYNNTYVVVRMDKPSEQESIVHLAADGHILFEKTYNDIIDFFGQLNDKEVIVCNVPESKIDIINLQTKKIIQVNHQYLFEDTVSMAIYTFSETRYFCIAERGSVNDHRLKLTYYSYDNIKEDSKPIAEWQSKDNEWTYEHNIEKMNNHSMVAWWLYKHDQEVTFTYFDLRSNPEGRLQVVKARGQLDNQYGVNGLALSISYLWQIKKDKYMLVAISNKFEHKDKCKDKNGVFNNNYIIDTTLGNDQGTIREVRFAFDIDKKDGFMFNDQLTDCFGIGNVSVFHTFKHEDGKTVTTPVYYVNNDTEEIIEKEEWENSCHSSNFVFPGWDSSTVVQSIHDNGDCEEISFLVRKVVDPKEINLHFLLHLNEDFDDDLLQDACEMLSKD